LASKVVDPRFDTTGDYPLDWMSSSFIIPSFRGKLASGTARELFRLLFFDLATKEG